MDNNKIDELLNKHNKNKEYPTNKEAFVDHVRRYIKATKESRLICCINHVSQSGMSRNMKFVEMNKSKYNNQHGLRNFYEMLNVLGYSFKGDYMKIGGCGMDMVFATHYNIIHNFERMGFITKKTCSTLEQMSPNTI